MKTKYLAIVGTAFLAGLHCSPAGNILVTTFDGIAPAGTRVVVDKDGAPLGVGQGYVAVGSFRTLTDAAIRTAGAAADWPALLADFEQFGAAGKVPNFAGVVSYDASAQLLDGSFLPGRPIYVLIGNAPDDPAASDQWLVYKSPDPFPVDNPISSGRVDLTNATANDFLVGGLKGGSVILNGTPLEPFGVLLTLELAAAGQQVDSSLRIVEIRPDLVADTIDLTWDSKAGAGYAIEFSEDLQVWEKIAEGIDSQGVMTAVAGLNLPAGTSRGFVRVAEE